MSRNRNDIRRRSTNWVWVFFLALLVPAAAGILFLGFRVTQNSESCTELATSGVHPESRFLYLVELGGNSDGWADEVTADFRKRVSDWSTPAPETPMELAISFSVDGRSYRPDSACLTKLSVLTGAEKDIDLFFNSDDPSSRDNAGRRLTSARDDQIELLAVELDAEIRRADFSGYAGDVGFTILPMWQDAAAFTTTSGSTSAGIGVFSPLISTSGDCLDFGSERVPPEELVQDCLSYGGLGEVSGVTSMKFTYPTFLIASAGQKTFADEMVTALCSIVEAGECSK